MQKLRGACEAARQNDFTKMETLSQELSSPGSLAAFLSELLAALPVGDSQKDGSAGGFQLGNDREANYILFQGFSIVCCALRASPGAFFPSRAILADFHALTQRAIDYAGSSLQDGSVAVISQLAQALTLALLNGATPGMVYGVLQAFSVPGSFSNLFTLAFLRQILEQLASGRYPLISTQELDEYLEELFRQCTASFANAFSAATSPSAPEGALAPAPELNLQLAGQLEILIVLVKWGALAYQANDDDDGKATSEDDEERQRSYWATKSQPVRAVRNAIDGSVIQLSFVVAQWAIGSQESPYGGLDGTLPAPARAGLSGLIFDFIAALSSVSYSVSADLRTAPGTILLFGLSELLSGLNSRYSAIMSSGGSRDILHALLRLQNTLLACLESLQVTSGINSFMAALQTEYQASCAAAETDGAEAAGRHSPILSSLAGILLTVSNTVAAFPSYHTAVSLAQSLDSLSGTVLDVVSSVCAYVSCKITASGSDLRHSAFSNAAHVLAELTARQQNGLCPSLSEHLAEALRAILQLQASSAGKSFLSAPLLAGVVTSGRGLDGASSLSSLCAAASGAGHVDPYDCLTRYAEDVALMANTLRLLAPETVAEFHAEMSTSVAARAVTEAVTSLMQSGLDDAGATSSADVTIMASIQNLILAFYFEGDAYYREENAYDLCGPILDVLAGIFGAITTTAQELLRDGGAGLPVPSTPMLSYRLNILCLAFSAVELLLRAAMRNEDTSDILQLDEDQYELLSSLALGAVDAVFPLLCTFALIETQEVGGEERGAFDQFRSFFLGAAAWTPAGAGFDPRDFQASCSQRAVVENVRSVRPREFVHDTAILLQLASGLPPFLAQKTRSDLQGTLLGTLAKRADVLMLCDKICREGCLEHALWWEMRLRTNEDANGGIENLLDQSVARLYLFLGVQPVQTGGAPLFAPFRPLEASAQSIIKGLAVDGLSTVLDAFQLSGQVVASALFFCNASERRSAQVSFVSLFRYVVKSLACMEVSLDHRVAVDGDDMRKLSLFFEAQFGLIESATKAFSACNPRAMALGAEHLPSDVVAEIQWLLTGQGPAGSSRGPPAMEVALTFYGASLRAGALQTFRTFTTLLSSAPGACYDAQGVSGLLDGGPQAQPRTRTGAFQEVLSALSRACSCMHYVITCLPSSPESSAGRAGVQVHSALDLLSSRFSSSPGRNSDALPFAEPALALLAAPEAWEQVRLCDDLALSLINVLHGVLDAVELPDLLEAGRRAVHELGRPGDSPPPPAEMISRASADLERFCSLPAFLEAAIGFFSKAGETLISTAQERYLPFAESMVRFLFGGDALCGPVESRSLVPAEVGCAGHNAWQEVILRVESLRVAFLDVFYAQALSVVQSYLAGRREVRGTPGAQEAAKLVELYQLSHREVARAAATAGLQVSLRGADYPAEYATGAWEMVYRISIAWADEMGLGLLADAAQAAVLALCSQSSPGSGETACRGPAEGLSSRIPHIRALAFSSAVQVLRGKAAKQAEAQGAPLPAGLEEALWSQESLFDESLAPVVGQYIQSSGVAVRIKVDGARVLSWAKSLIWEELAR